VARSLVTVFTGRLDRMLSARLPLRFGRESCHLGGIRLRSGLRRDIFSSKSWWLLEENIKGLWFLTEHPPHGVH
jgi:hypothetical protein